MPYRAKEKNQKARRKPVQERSIQRYNKILDSAATLIQGPKKLSTNLIAENAGMSVGAVYQFFPNIESVKGALIERVMDKLYYKILGIIETRPVAPDLQEFASEILEVVHNFYNDYPDVVEIIVSMQHTKEFDRVNSDLNNRLVDLLVDYYARSDNTLSSKELRRKGNLSMALGDTMTILIWTAADEQDRQKYLDDWRKLITLF